MLDNGASLETTADMVVFISFCSQQSVSSMISERMPLFFITSSRSTNVRLADTVDGVLDVSVSRRRFRPLGVVLLTVAAGVAEVVRPVGAGAGAANSDGCKASSEEGATNRIPAPAA